MDKIASGLSPIGKKAIWYLSIGRNALVVLICSAIAYTLSVSGFDSLFHLTGEIKTGLPNATLPNYGLGDDFLTIVLDLESILFTLPLIAVVGQIAIAKSFCKD